MKTKSKLFLAGLLAVVVAGCVTTQSWEYRTRTTKERMGKSELDQYGNSGWELVQFQMIPVVVTFTNYTSATHEEFEYIFKRPKK